MASYRYERDIDPKDLKPRKQRQYSRRERWANWWDYNLKWVLLFGIAGAFVAYCFIGQYFLTTHPDYNVAVVSPYYLPEATVTALQEQLAAYGEDCMHDMIQHFPRIRPAIASSCRMISGSRCSGGVMMAFSSAKRHEQADAEASFWICGMIALTSLRAVSAFA